MPNLRSLPTGARLLDVFTRYPETTRPLIEYHEVLLRGPSPLSVAERELIAAYVSGLNACRYCHGIHARTAEAFGIEEGALEVLLQDVDAAAGIDDRMKPLLRYAKKLTQTPARMTEADAEPVYAAGWDETALFHAVSICALFNFMNRLVEGCGLKGDPGYALEAGPRLMSEGYLPILERMAQAGG